MSAVAVFHANHAEHLREALRAHDAGLPVFLGNPHWAGAEHEEAARQIPRGTTILGATLEPRGLGTCDFPLNWRGRVMIPTGGTGGKVKFIIHSGETLRARQGVHPNRRRAAVSRRRSRPSRRHPA